MIRSGFLCLTVAVGVLDLAETAKLAAEEVVPYVIEPGSIYTYKPSPWLSIPGGEPSPYQLDFGVNGTLSIEYDRMAATARLLNVELVLTGNEAVQMNPPYELMPVTADRVEDWLEARLFHNLFVLAPVDQYQAENPSGLYLYDFLNGAVQLQGGYDITFVDGDGMLFNVAARVTPIPEPGSLALAGIALIFASRQFFQRCGQIGSS